MAHVSLKAQECSVVLKNGKIRFQAFRYDFSGEVTDQVTITLPLKEAGKFNCIQIVGKDTEIGERTNRNRIENLLGNEDQQTK